MKAELVTELKAFAGLTALVGSAIYPQVIPQGAALPAVVYSMIDQARLTKLNGVTDGLADYLVTLDAWATTDKAATDISEQIRQALEAATGFSAVHTSARDDYEPETRRYRVSVDFSIWI